MQVIHGNSSLNIHDQFASVFKRMITTVELIKNKPNCIANLPIATNIHFIVDIAKKTIIKILQILVYFTTFALFLLVKETEHNYHSFKTGIICVFGLK